MFRKHKDDHDWDLRKLTDEQLEALPLEELQRIRNKRWANGLIELQQRAGKELARRDPRNDWSCLRCNRIAFTEREMRVSGGFLESFLNWEVSKYHAIVCNYCGKTEFYKIQMPASEKIFDLSGG